MKEEIIVRSESTPDVTPIEQKIKEKNIVSIFFQWSKSRSLHLIYKKHGKKKLIIIPQNPPRKDINSDKSE